MNYGSLRGDAIDMSRRKESIVINHFDDDYGSGISIEKIAIKNLPDFAKVQQPERHDRHTFHLLEEGTITIEIDFNTYEIKSSSVIYMHPNQVHRILTFDNLLVSSWAINNENLNPEYLKLLEDIAPSKPLPLDDEMFSLLFEAVSLCLKFSDRKTDKLYQSILKDSCNALVALVLSQYVAQAGSTGKLSRFDSITKAFKQLLEHN